MKVREFQPADFDDCIKALKRLHRKTVYSEFKFDPMRVRHTLAWSMNSAKSQTWVVEHEGRVRGILIGMVDTLWWCAERYATDLVMYSEVPGGAEAMIALFVKWAQGRKVAEITMGQSSGIHVHRAEQVYINSGFQEVGGMFVQIPQAREEAA